MMLRDKLTPANIFLLAAIIYLATTAAALLVQWPAYLPMVLFGLAWIILAIGHNQRSNVVIFFVLLAASVAIYRAQDELSHQPLMPQGEWQGQANVLEAKKKGSLQKLVVFLPTGQPKNVGVKAAVNAPSQPTYQPGDQVEISCQLETPQNQQEKFNYIRYLAKDRIFYLCQKPKIKKIFPVNDHGLGKTGSVDAHSVGFVAVREKLEKNIAMNFPPPEGSYLAGLLVGGDGRLSEKWQTAFRRTGMTHAVAVSGYNITIIGEYLLILAIRFGLWRRGAVWLASFGIVGFVLLAGSPSSAVRAAIMGIVALVAMQSGRLSNTFRAILFSATGMVIHSPLVLLYDIGFQLSFLATVGIVSFSSLINSNSDNGDRWWQLLKTMVVSTLGVTIAAQAGVLGISLFYFEVFSPVSFLANILVLPLVPITMAGGLAVVVLGSFLPVVGEIFSPLVWWLLHFQLLVIDQLSQWRLASVQLPGIGIVWVVGYYILFLMAAISFGKNNKIANQETNDE